MTDRQRWIILTDLDGTLLDHHDYSTDAAKPILTYLAQQNIPCIFNTSKTFAEVVQLRRDLNITAPFACENGSALFIPKKDNDPLSSQQDDYNTEILGTSYAELIKVLHQARQQGFKFRSFNDMPASEVTAVTGLNEQDAWLAKQRNASEPLLWLDEDETGLATFRNFIESQQLTLIKGGRFYHVMGQANKASAIEFFRNLYADHYQIPADKIGVIALGDGENDRAMLEQCDQPIVIPPANGEPLKLNNPTAITAKFQGPKGWNNSLLTFFNSLKIDE